MEPVLALSDIINSGASTRAPGWNFFNGIDISETQSTLPWCGAYCATAIIRSQTNHRVYAGNLMAVCYPNETMSERIEHGTKIPHDYITYAESLGMTKLAYRDYQLILSLQPCLNIKVSEKLERPLALTTRRFQPKLRNMG